MKNCLTIENVTVQYGAATAIKDVSFSLEEGGYLGIIGPNGGGKSTLIKVIAGLIAPMSGSVRFETESRPMIGYVPQFATVDKRFPMTVTEAVLQGRLKQKIIPFFTYSKEDKKEADALIEKVGLSPLKNRLIGELSGGEFQKALIARALATRPKLLLLDEPTASVDTVSRESIYHLISDINKTGITVILVTHDLFAVSSEVKSLACLNGALVYHGEPKLSESVVRSLYGCPVDLIAHGVPHRTLGIHKDEEDGKCC